MTRDSPTLILFLVLAAAFVIHLDSVIGDSSGSPVVSQTRRRAQTRTRAPAAVDYSNFLHSTRQHQGECHSCHKIPTNNWEKSRGFPDVADYPDHDACVSCHRQQFFRGARPVICTNCHTIVSPRDDARLPFRNPESSRQFTIEFPHDRHQDVIAMLPKTGDLLPPVVLVKASFSGLAFAGADEKKTYNNCEICHQPRSANLVAPPGGWVDGFVPEPRETFKSSPQSHAACFNCHWQAQAPVSNQCEGCHKPVKPAQWVDFPTRISMKFRHSREQHVAECTACHINITKSASLRGLKADVPITACSECHNKAPSHLEISGELEQLDKNREFVCVYCHTSDVGKRDAPVSHYRVAERLPLSRKDIK